VCSFKVIPFEQLFRLNSFASEIFFIIALLVILSSNYMGLSYLETTCSVWTLLDPLLLVERYMTFNSKFWCILQQNIVCFWRKWWVKFSAANDSQTLQKMMVGFFAANRAASANSVRRKTPTVQGPVESLVNDLQTERAPRTGNRRIRPRRYCCDRLTPCQPVQQWFCYGLYNNDA